MTTRIAFSRGPTWVCLLLGAAPFLALPIASGPAWAQDKPLMQSGELEKRVEVVVRLAYGSERRPLPTTPWTEDRLREYATRYGKTLGEASYGVAAGQSRLSFEFAELSGVAEFALGRLRIMTDSPTVANQKELLRWYDADLAYRQARLQDLDRALEVLQRCARAKRQLGFSLEAKREQQLSKSLSELEDSLAEYLSITQAVCLLRWLEGPLNKDQQEKFQARLKRVRSDLPAGHQDDDLKALDDLWRRQRENVFSLASKLSDTGYYSDVLRDVRERCFQDLRKLNDKGESQQRRDLEREFALNISFQTGHTDYLMHWTAKRSRLLVLQGHFDRCYARSAKSSLSQVTILPLSKEHGSFGKNIEDDGLKLLDRCEKHMAALEEIVNNREDRWSEFRDWLGTHGPAIGERLLEGMVNDMTQWMEEMPSTRRVVKEELLILLGVSRDERLKKLSPEERNQVGKLKARTLKEIKQSFDQDTIYRARQDIELIKSMVKSYPPRDLVFVEKPQWENGPKARIRAADCRDLDESSAAAAYLRLFDQFEEDVATYLGEVNRLQLAFSLTTMIHLRGAASRK